MPTVPFLEPHTEGVKIFVKKVQNCDTLNNGLILSVDIELDFVSGETMSQTKLSQSEIILLKVLVL
jgi:hypothetical protein